MDNYEKAWNEIINGDFKDNPIFKDVLREMTKNFGGYDWQCVEKVLIEKKVFKERDSKWLRILTPEGRVNNQARLARALTYTGLIRKERSIITGLAASEPKSVDAYKERVGLLKEMLPTKDNNVYCSFDKDSLTDKSDKYKFKLTDDTIIGVNEGVISYRKDGTCIILMQNNKKATDRKYYKVKVEGGKLYDASKNPPKLVSMGKSDGGGQNPEPTKPIESITSGKDNGHEWVDLGLSVKWATCNVGASSPGEYGINFAWGEIAPKSEYEWENLKYRVSAGSSGKLKFSKYVATGEYGLVDNRTRLELSDDAAYEQWGGGWRMPTEAECQELVDKCQWSWTTEGGHVGYRVTGPNGRSIFLPAAGCRGGSSLNDVGDYGSYWSSSLYTSNSNGASYLGFNSGDHYVSNGLRRLGRSVRPVTE